MGNFAAFTREHGLLISDLLADGRVHRCPTEGHPKSRNGAYRFFGEWGWCQDWSLHEEPIIWQANKDSGATPVIARRDIEKMRREEVKRKADAAILAANIVRRCRTNIHPYLKRKGFPNEAGLIDTDGRLVIPMRDVVQYKRINSVQWIDDAGNKLFLPGGAAKGSILMIGTGTEKWLCEGYATGLSIRTALKNLYRSGCVVVCFSAGNLAHVATQMSGKRYVIADNDKSGTGERAAVSTGLPWAMPPDVGHDANDMHQEHGVRALAELMRFTLEGAK